MRGRRRHLSQSIQISQIRMIRTQISRIRTSRTRTTQLHQTREPVPDLPMIPAIPENRHQRPEAILTEPGKRIRMVGGMSCRVADMYQVPGMESDRPPLVGIRRGWPPEDRMDLGCGNRKMVLRGRKTRNAHGLVPGPAGRKMVLS